MSVPSIPLHKLTRVATSAAIVAATYSRVWAIMLVGGTASSTLTLYDAASATGTQVLEFIAPFTDADASAASTVFVDFTLLGGVSFPSIGIYATLGGTGAIAYIWWD